MSCRAVLVLLTALAVPGMASAADGPARVRHDRVDVAPTKTSIYIGVVSMTLPTFERHDGAFTAPYQAKVFPYFFYNESGQLSVQISDAQLAQLDRGEPIEFVGRAVRSDGEERRVEGKATPTDPTQGKIKVRVFVSKRVELIFNTTYRFPSE